MPKYPPRRNNARKNRRNTKRPVRRYPARKKAPFKRKFQRRVETILMSEGTSDTAKAPGMTIFHTASPPAIDQQITLFPEKSFFQATSYNSTNTTLDQQFKIKGIATNTRYLNMRAEVDFTPCIAQTENDTRFRVICGYLPLLMPEDVINGGSYQKFVEDQLNNFYKSELLFGGLGQKNIFRVIKDKTYSITPKSVANPNNATAANYVYRRNIQISASYPLTRGKHYFMGSDTPSATSVNNLVMNPQAGNRIAIPFLFVQNLDGLGDPAEGTAPKISYRWSHYLNDA